LFVDSFTKQQQLLLRLEHIITIHPDKQKQQTQQQSQINPQERASLLSFFSIPKNYHIIANIHQANTKKNNEKYTNYNT
jgi:hypothetical protein